MHELRLAARRLAERPGSTIASIATLACAIAAAAATWAVLSAVLLHPLPIREPARVLVLGYETPGRTGPMLYTGFRYPTYQQVRDAGIFDQTVAQWNGTHLLLVNAGDVPLRTDVGFVTHDFFEALGVRAVLGREFLAEDDRRGATPVAVLTDRYWRAHFEADPAVIGRTIEIQRKPVTIVGVLQDGFRGMTLSETPALYLAFHTLADVGGPLTNYFAEPDHSSSPTLGTVIVGRLKPQGTAAEAESRIAALALTDIRAPARPVAIRAAVAAIPPSSRRAMQQFSTLLAATVGLLLLIGCTTVGMLLLIRTEERRGEFAVCLALGASRRRLVRGFTLEGILMAAAGSIAALPVSSWLLAILRRFELPGRVPIEVLGLGMGLPLLTALAVASGVAVLLIALVAATSAFRADVTDALRTRSGVTTPRASRTARSALAAAQVAVTVPLLGGAGLFARSLLAALSLNPGLDMSSIAIGTVALGQYGYPPERASEFFDTLRSRLATEPAIESFSMSRWEGGMSPAGRLAVDGIPRQFSSLVSFISVDPQYFRTMGITLLAGRNFGADDGPAATPVAVVSESLARALEQAGTPLGRRIQTGARADTPVQIVGVASDVITNVEVVEPLIIYMPASQRRAASHVDLTLRARDVTHARRQVLAAVRALDPQVSPTELRTLEERVAAQMAPQRLGRTVLTGLGVIAALLTLLGMYVLAESLATARMREMGIRAALGATRRQIGSTLLAETGRLVGVGLVTGLALAWLGAGTIRAFLFQVQPLDALTLGATTAGIFVLSLAVSTRAALRVARVDPAQVLRAE